MRSTRSFWPFDGSIRAATMSRRDVQAVFSRRLSNSTAVPSMFISIYIAPASSLGAISLLFTQKLERCHPRLPSRWTMFLALCTCPSSSRNLLLITHFPFLFCSNLDISPSNALIHQLQPHLSCTIIIVKASLESDSFSPSFSHQSRLKSELLALPIRLQALVLNMTSHTDHNVIPADIAKDATTDDDSVQARTFKQYMCIFLKVNAADHLSDARQILRRREMLA